MAPSLQPSGTSSAPSSETQTSSVLPGLKRGIAVGVASSVCLILIALLAFFALRRRKQRKTQRQQGHSPDAKELPAWSEEDKTSVPPEKNWILIPPSPSEADTRAIYELDASPVPELPTKIHISGAQELDAEGGNEGVIDVNRENATTRDSLERRWSSEPRYSDIPILRISPPEMSPLSGTSRLGISPLAVSPLEEVHLPQSPRSPRSPQHSAQHW